MAARPGSLRETEWEALLELVQAGRTAILGALHKRDTVALGSLARHGLPVQLHLGIGNWMGCYHWAPASDLFAGLPAGSLAGPAYVDVLPWYVLSELGGEVLAGSFRNSMTRFEAPRALWFSDVEIVQHGAGEIIFCQYRILDRAGAHPLAARLTSNRSTWALSASERGQGTRKRPCWMPKIAFLGAGSTVFARQLLTDILSFPELAEFEVALHDIDAERLSSSRVVASRVAEALGAHPTLSATTDRRAALDGADYAICMIQVGGYRPAHRGRFRDPQELRPAPDHRRHAGHRRHHARPAHHSGAAGHVPRHGSSCAPTSLSCSTSTRWP